MKKDEKKTIYLHIGSNKTGSSALQAFFYENSIILEKKGIYYPPQSGYWNKEFKISSGNAVYLLDDCDQYPLGEKGINKINSIFSLTEKYSKILLSSEWLWSINDKTTFFNNFKKENIEIVVIVYLRRQDEYLESAINQKVKVTKYNKTVTYPECLNQSKQSGAPLEELDYYKELEKIKLAIGVSNIIVRPYEKLQFKNNNIFSDFLSIFNLELTDDFILPPPIVNPRLNRDFMEIKRICNSLPIDNNTLVNVFHEPLMKLSTNTESSLNEFEYSLFSYEEKLDIINKYDDSNQKIAREYLGRMNGKLFIDPLPKNNENSKPYSGPSMENVVMAFGYLLCKQIGEIDELKKDKNEHALKISECIKNVEKLSSKIDLLDEENKRLLEKHSILEDKFDEIVSEYYRLLNSKSWQITKPLRIVRNFFKQ
ncbi:hypothetical protein [Clostridium sp.]|uniref:hypothetical protein n=1 Tax=Clostridium sp. TaxID=1506 RepID=UPI0026182E4B|nr:hypothetical protein [Clostridium sp.]